MSLSHSLTFTHTYAELPSIFYAEQSPTPLNNPVLVSVNEALAEQLGITLAQLNSPEMLDILSGEHLLPSMRPLAMKYTGHQFGSYNPQLGDGRGLLLGEQIAPDGTKWDWHLKGAGQTPYSRFGDGRAVLRSSIREYLGSEALHNLGVPSTRALALINSSTPVDREKRETGATLLRVTPSHIRFGHFELCFYTEQPQAFKQLAQHVIAHHYPELTGAENPYLALLESIIKRTASMIAHWQALGFCHGVMNTDNMSVLGETFDYGPFAFLDDYDPKYICNHSDYSGRYAFDQQPKIGLWNVSALGYAFTAVLSKDDVNEALELFEPTFNCTFLDLMRKKLGFDTTRTQHQDIEVKLVNELLSALAIEKPDYTLFFRALSSTSIAQLQQFLSQPHQVTVDPNISVLNSDTLRQWALTYCNHSQQYSVPNREQNMLECNPKYILRNYLAQEAINSAEQGDYSKVNKLLDVLRKPYSEQVENERYASAPPNWGKCMEISCSS